MTRGRDWRIAATLACAAWACACGKPAAGPSPADPWIPARVVETPHYLIHASATQAQTRIVGDAVEQLRVAYAALLPPRQRDRRLQLVLYADQAEFKRNNRSSAWAEAWYRRPYAFAYPGGGRNPHHWMLHEATHQLLAEVGGYKLRPWLNEGVAAYFGASRLRHDGLHPGEPDPDAYPVWWLDAVAGRAGGTPTFEGDALIRLQRLLEGKGPGIDTGVNAYYVASWSLVHYLIDGDGGAHRAALPALLEQGGDPGAFRQLIGDYAQVEPRWHAHLLALARRDGSPANPASD